MSFSMAAIQKDLNYCLRFRRKFPFKEPQPNKIVTLQVRILNRMIANSSHGRHGKKAFLPVPASMTLEAALALSLFLFASVSLILPMKIMTTERRGRQGWRRWARILAVMLTYRMHWNRESISQCRVRMILQKDFAKILAPGSQKGMRCPERRGMWIQEMSFGPICCVLLCGRMVRPLI